ncbi:unnamed protein product [Meganyctiphanes norvegica]|uniref:Lipocalin/cytosolic fatty-acid binding domain-containing protein n=1 Tax=Meganyctiphanes norvegica TaxID=48144 RepID=A0AAV2Q333_MEGNR
MYTISPVIAAILLLLPCALGQWGIPEEGVCPEVTLQPDFDLQKYLGRWYELAHAQWAFGTEANTCMTSDFVEQGVVSEAKVYQGEVFWALGESVNIQTEAEMYETEEDPAALWVYYGEGDPGEIGKANHYVLSTDYENYACVFNCVQVDETTREMFAFLMARTNLFDSDADPICETIFRDLGVNIANMLQTEHGDDCFYFPEP